MSDYHSKGGKSSQASLTPEERSRRAKKGARKLGKAGRSARVAKAWVTRRRVADEAKAISAQTNAHFQAIFQREIDKAEAKGQIHPTNAAEMRGAVKPGSAPPKPGTMGASVLKAMSDLKHPNEIGIITEGLRISGIPTDRREVGNVLSSLARRGHVVSEPMSGSKREKLWRLA